MKPYNLHWHGMLTTGNVVEVGKLMTELLTGKFFTFVAMHPTLLPEIDAAHPQTIDMRVDARPSQKLFADPGKQPINARVENGYGHKSIYDTYGLAMLDTNLQGAFAPFDHLYKNPYFSFDGNRVTIWHRAPAGNLLVWTYAVENHEE